MWLAFLPTPLYSPSIQTGYKFSSPHKGVLKEIAVQLKYHAMDNRILK